MGNRNTLTLEQQDQEISPLLDYGSTDNFCDPEFPAERSSLSKDPELREEWKDLIWKRPAAFDHNSRLFADEIRSSDVQQGALGTCYFMAPLCCLAEAHPALVRSLIARSGNSRYTAKLIVNGVRRNVTVDDRLPCKEGRGGPRTYFAHAHKEVLWPALLEKTWAKVHGCYDKAASGSERDAIFALTGCSSLQHLDHKEAEGVWEKVSEGI